MPRALLDEDHVHPSIRDNVATYHRTVVSQVQQAIEQHAVVVVGMRVNPFPKKARRCLDQAGISHEYLEFGSYFSDWHRRLALKMWSGWSTFPMVFVRGTLVGGASDLKRLVDSGELARLLAAPA